MQKNFLKAVLLIPVFVQKSNLRANARKLKKNTDRCTMMELAES
jgi:hypothetical protein